MIRGGRGSERQPRCHPLLSTPGVFVSAEYGYGASGSPPSIPGGATLVFEVELLSWQSEKDICGAQTWREEGVGVVSRGSGSG